MTSEIPLSYLPGLAGARKKDSPLAELYVRHSLIGDPPADSILAELGNHDPALGQQWIHRGIELGPSALDDAPENIRRFFADIEQVPHWFDSARALPGCRAFHRHSQMFTGAFVAAVLIEGFSTLISKSFSITGKLVDQGVRRLKQNNRHLLEIFLPHGLERNSDGWKLSLRIRLVHARVRQLLARSPDWDEKSWGTPLSSAHIAFATASFSGLLLHRAAMLGVRLNAEERESFMMTWRYTGHLMGVHPDLLFADEASAMHLYRIGRICEPPPETESILLANGLIQSAPLVAGFTDPAQRSALARKIFRISRAMIGNELADQLNYPQTSTFGVLALLQWQNKLDHFLQHLFPSVRAFRRQGGFAQMLDVSHYAPEGLAYHMPGHVHAEKDSP